MSEDKEFDNGIREQLEGKRFGFKEASWEKMQVLIREDELKSKKRRFFFILSLVFTAIAALAGFWLVREYNLPETPVSETRNAENNFVKEQKENVLGSATTSAALPVETAKETAQDNRIISETEKKPGNESAAAPQLSGDEKETAAAEKTKEVISSPSVEKNTEHSGKNKKIIKENLSGKLRAGAGRKKIKQDFAGKIPLDDETNRAKEFSENQPGITGKIVNNDVQYSNKKSKDTAGVVNADKQVQVEQKPAEKQIAAAENALKDSINATTNSDSTEISPAAAEPAQSAPASPVQSPLFLSFDAGAYYMPGFHRDTLKEGKGVSPYAGASIQKIFPSGFCMGTGLYYSYLGNVSKRTRLLSDTAYAFGYSAQFIEIIVKKLHYLEVPLLAGFYSRKNIFLGGISFSYHFTSASKVSSYTESYGVRQDSKRELGGEVLSSTEYGYMDGFSSWDLAVQLMYRREITERIGAAVSFRYGLKDIKKDSYFLKTEIDRNMGLNILLTYKLMK